VKIGADNPDNYYQSAAISGRCAYRIRGTRGTVYYLGFGTYAGSYGSKTRMAQTGYLEGKDLRLEPDGSFEITVSCTEHSGASAEGSRPPEASGVRAGSQAGNWLRMEPDTSSLIVRQTFRDRQAERIADLHIERADAHGPPQPITPELIDRGLAAAATYVNGTAALFADWAEGFARRGVNQLHRLDPAVANAAHGDPNIFYYHGYWELDAGEALIIEVTPPPCDYWNLQINNHWMESLDYRYHTIAVNHHGATYRPDGSVQIVVAHENPGIANWLETAGHRRGTMCWRWIRAASHPQPATRVVTVGDLKG